ncbi:MAG: quinolinate synthase NadA [Lachnospiraceae bacterium]|nr:quinolinate synthase NadA [Lachnospiraceae bacterium]MDY4971268.1 quinolinate synthase NadA [Lachnospiraceae bacterium]
MQIIEKIKKLKEEKNAVILAHYYVADEVQAVADYVGDSFYLSKVAVNLTAQVIVFCGVSFMGESAKLLNPDKMVLMPDMKADCAMAHMADPAYIAEMKREYEDLQVVCYINSTAELKALSDVCVTSANAVDIVKELPGKNILFIPDENLGRHVAKQVPEKHFIFNPGCCPVHAQMKADEVKKLKELHPQAPVLTHPECREDILALSDYIGSTSGIIGYAAASEKEEFIICTESGVAYELGKRAPGRTFYFPETLPVCMDMKLITLEKIADVLEDENGQVHVDAGISEAACRPLRAMLELAEQARRKKEGK